MEIKQPGTRISLAGVRVKTIGLSLQYSKCNSPSGIQLPPHIRHAMGVPEFLGKYLAWNDRQRDVVLKLEPKVNIVEPLESLRRPAFCQFFPCNYLTRISPVCRIVMQKDARSLSIS